MSFRDYRSLLFRFQVFLPMDNLAGTHGLLIPLISIVAAVSGMEMTREGKTTQSAAIVVFASALVNPAFGWSLTFNYKRY